jgi:hypothetical protein
MDPKSDDSEHRKSTAAAIQRAVVIMAAELSTTEAS